MTRNDQETLEDRITFYRHQVKELQAEVKELRQMMNGLAHAVAVVQETKKQPLWVQEYYRRWENKHKNWWGLE